MKKNYEAIILSVGKSWEPILYTLEYFQPKFAAFLCTPDSCETLDKVLEKYPMSPSFYQIFQIPDDPQAIGQMIIKWYDAYTWLRKEKNLESSVILVDPTGGRKWMSSGVTIIASYLGANLGYVDVIFKDGKPDPTTMRCVDLGNAYDQTGFLEIERGIQFFNVGAWENAQETFQRIHSHHSSLNDLTIGMAKLSEMMKYWDLFVHYNSDLSSGFEEILQILNRVSFTDQSYSDKVKSLIEDVKRFKRVSSRIIKEQRPNLIMTVDLFLNAKRCITKGRLDDGVARLYRCLESLAQFFLLKDYGIKTSEPDFNKLDSNIVEQFRNYKGGHLPDKLACEDDYLLLFFARHPVLGRSVITGFSSKTNRPINIFHKLLEKRNNSIMAHGFDPIEEKVAYEMLLKVEELLERSLGDEFQVLKEELQFPIVQPIFIK